MRLSSVTALVSGGASGLGLATARELASAGASVVIVDLPSSSGVEVAASLGGGARFIPADVTDEDQLAAAFAATDDGSLRVVVHTAGRGRPQRIVLKSGEPALLAPFEDVIRLNVIGTFNVLRLSAAQMARQESVDGERGVIVLTSSIAGTDGQIGQIAYSASKAAIDGMTLCAARDLASKQIRVCTIAPGIFETPLMAGVTAEIRSRLDDSVPNPRRMGVPEEYASLALEIVRNTYLNGATLRLDGALRLGPS
ncbi:SDR family NAD(P)-dependent oxidoreductase [Jatrophihabitans sp.]|uniref:SDR family NAD(P)-dependent oxidoreductase n=1 Tax=Jatrophihabitans sp. TaxID=1932789 RepID=UPI0030C67F5F|nr:3-hydroxyacyl-CoA dehydrogenase type-2 [Jatrophihabitans sp.]